MSDDAILSLCREYLDLIAQMRSPDHDADARRYLSAQRTLAHDALIQALGPGYERPFDMKAWARAYIDAPAVRAGAGMRLVL